MRRLKITVLSTLALALALSLSPATARAYDLDVEVSAFVGAHIFSDAVRLGRTSAANGNALQHTGAFGVRIGFLLHQRLALEAELGLVPSETRDRAASVMVIGYRAQLLFNILTGRVRPFILAGGGAQTSSSSNSDVLTQDTNYSIHAGAGLAVDITCHVGLRLDGRVLFGPTVRPPPSPPFTQDGEVTLSLYGRFGKGIEKVCAARAAKLAPPDGDLDGLPDSEDRCPIVPGPKENGGCPDGDRDRDGVVDRLDKCPDVAGRLELAGCPEPTPEKLPEPIPDPDADGDGVIDRLDKCPAKAGPADNGGCPNTDIDGDGILDKDDRCPDQPETKNGFEDDDGCPDVLPASYKEFTGRVEGITFTATTSDVLDKSSAPTLDRAVSLLKKMPALGLAIEVHTADEGKRDANLALSQARANVLLRYFVDHGIAAERLTAKGFGATKPISSNRTPTGKAQNRRIEFRHLP